MNGRSREVRKTFAMRLINDTHTRISLANCLIASNYIELIVSIWACCTCVCACAYLFIVWIVTACVNDWTDAQKEWAHAYWSRIHCMSRGMEAMISYDIFFDTHTHTHSVCGWFELEGCHAMPCASISFQFRVVAAIACCFFYIIPSFVHSFKQSLDCVHFRNSY